MIARFLTLLPILLVLTSLPAQDKDAAQTTAQAPVAQSSQVPPNTTVRDANGKEINVGPGGKATLKHNGKLKNHPTEPGIKICDEILEVTVRSGGCESITLKGKMGCTIERSSTTVTSNGGAGTPPSTDGADITVTGDNVTVNANGTNTNITTTSSAQGTTINTGSGSSGNVTYPGSGYSGSINVGAGSGGWTMGPG